MKKSIDVLGTRYGIKWRAYADDPLFAQLGVDGYCENSEKLIVCCRLRTHPRWGDASEEAISASQRELLRHEVVHAFLKESGLDCCSLTVNIPWAENEEMVDWLAIQGPKIYAAWQKLGCAV